MESGQLNASTRSDGVHTGKNNYYDEGDGRDDTEFLKILGVLAFMGVCAVLFLVFGLS